MQTKSFHFTRLNLPAARLKAQLRNNRWEVWDPLRGKWLVLTDEEWVRQNFVDFLVSSLAYPASLISNEVSLTLNATPRRADTVVYGRDGRQPLMIVEYKAPTVAVTQEVFDQIVRYNLTLHARFLTVTNGLSHYCCMIDHDKGTYTFMRQIPAYDEMTRAAALP